MRLERKSYWSALLTAPTLLCLRTCLPQVNKNTVSFIYDCISYGFCEWILFSSVCLGEGSEITHRFSISSCENTQRFICQEKTFTEYNEEIVLVLSTQSKDYTLYIYIYIQVFCFFHWNTVFVFRFCVCQWLGLRGWKAQWWSCRSLRSKQSGWTSSCL